MKLLFVENSYLKKNSKQSSETSPELLIVKNRNQVIDVSEVFEAENDHLKITSNGQIFYVYDPHVQVFDNTGKVVSSFNVIDEKSPQINTDKIPDGQVKPAKNVKTVRINHYGTVEWNSPIFPGSNFYWFEATHNFTRQPESKQIVGNIISLAKRLQPHRDKINLKFTVTSWYRPPAINRAVNGARRSQHLNGGAVDILIDGWDKNTAYAYFDRNWESAVGEYRNIDITHLDIRSTRARWRN